MPSVTLWDTKGLCMQTNIPKDDLLILNKHIAYGLFMQTQKVSSNLTNIVLGA